MPARAGRIRILAARRVARENRRSPCRRTGRRAGRSGRAGRCRACAARRPCPSRGCGRPATRTTGRSRGRRRGSAPGPSGGDPTAAARGARDRPPGARRRTGATRSSRPRPCRRRSRASARACARSRRIGAPSMPRGMWRSRRTSAACVPRRLPRHRPRLRWPRRPQHRPYRSRYRVRRSVPRWQRPAQRCPWLPSRSRPRPARRRAGGRRRAVWRRLLRVAWRQDVTAGGAPQGVDSSGQTAAPPAPPPGSPRPSSCDEPERSSINEGISSG